MAELRLFSWAPLSTVNRSGLARTQQALAKQLQYGLPVEDIADFHENTCPRTMTFGSAED